MTYSVTPKWTKVNDSVYRLESIVIPERLVQSIAVSDLSNIKLKDGSLLVHVLGGGYISSKSLSKLNLRHNDLELVENPTDGIEVLSNTNEYSVFFSMTWFDNNLKEYFDV